MRKATFHAQLEIFRDTNFNFGQNQGVLSEIRGVKVSTFSTKFLGQHLISKYGIKPTQN